MDFKKATDALFEPVGHADLAKALGVSVALIRQARLNSEAAAHRSAPEGWEKAVADLAEKWAAHYRNLLEIVRGKSHENDGEHNR
jgi:hypothetical protein